ncbi:MAG: hypothetical protein GWP91_16050, partial [Rhodobacterales bacterium]|nr:hypothetical protein [Rhodobacterales bacterium]
MTSLLMLLALTACNTPTPESNNTLTPDLTVLLAPDQARVGAVTDETALWGGISAEATGGDYKIYNHKVQFAIQAPREGSYYLPEGGSVIDADVIRPPGMPGQDLVDEWVGMAGLGRLLDAKSIEVVDNGLDSGIAILTARGYETPMALIEGALEAPGQLIPDLGLKIEHTYILPADSWLMEVQTTVTATDQEATFAPGDTLFGAADIATWWGPLTGYDGI